MKDWAFEHPFLFTFLAYCVLQLIYGAIQVYGHKRK